MHASVVALTGQTAYNHAFSAAPYDANHDGVLSTSELGTSAVGSLPATESSIDSIFYGTVINALKSFDAQELNDLTAFDLRIPGRWTRATRRRRSRCSRC